MERWFNEKGGDTSHVVYSRARLVRNWSEYPFPSKMTREQSAQMTKSLLEGLKDIGSVDGRTYRFLYLNQLSELERAALLERRVLNRSAVKQEMPSGLILSEDERVSIVINSDDHIRIRVLEPGLAIEKCYELANRIDDFIGERFSYSFDEKYGYLTSFPTNVGTGLRASAVLHLPVLSGKKNFSSLVADMGRFGTLVRGVYGEGGENFGSLYQVSNQRTLGQPEPELVSLAEKAAAELGAQEQRLRREILRQRKLARMDEVYKSYGVLKYARKLTRKDGMEFLSQLMAGEADGILKFQEPCSIYGLMLGIQPANLLQAAGRPLNKEELDGARAEFLRERLPELASV